MENENNKTLVFNVLENGLPALGELVQATLGCPFYILRQDGHILYQTEDINIGSNDKGRLEYPVDTLLGKYSLVLTKLKPEQLQGAMQLLKKMEFPLQCFFSQSRHKSNIAPSHGGSIRYSVDGFLKKSVFDDIVSRHCEQDVRYYVSVIESTREEQRFMAVNLKRKRGYSISIRNNNALILILRHSYNPITNSYDEAHPTKEDRQDMFDRLVKTYKGTPKFANGRSYYPEDLYQSYQQAIFTMYFMKSMGEQYFLKNFKDLDYGIPLFRDNWKAIAQYCEKELADLIQRDEGNNSDYFATLMTYMDNNLSAKETAEDMYVHVNTMAYRLKKLESITNRSLSHIKDTSHLYITLKIYKAILDSGLISDGEDKKEISTKEFGEVQQNI